MRLLAALLVAAFVTIGLFYLMQSLISGGEGAMSEPPRGSVLDFVRTPEPEEVQEKERKPERPPEPEQPPEDLPQPQMDNDIVDADSGSGYDFSASMFLAEQHRCFLLRRIARALHHPQGLLLSRVTQAQDRNLIRISD